MSWCWQSRRSTRRPLFFSLTVHKKTTKRDETEDARELVGAALNDPGSFGADADGVALRVIPRRLPSACPAALVLWRRPRESLVRQRIALDWIFSPPKNVGKTISADLVCDPVILQIVLTVPQLHFLVVVQRLCVNAATSSAVLGHIVLFRWYESTRWSTSL